MAIRRILCAALALLLMMLSALPALAAVQEPGREFYFLDEANVLSEALEGEIYFSNKRLSAACGAQMVVVTIDSTGGREISEYAVELFNQWGIGDREANNGFLLLLAVGDENYYALCGDNLQPKLGAGQLKAYLDEYLEAEFAAKRYEDGVKKFYEVVFKRIADTYNADVTVEQGIEDYLAWKGQANPDAMTASAGGGGIAANAEEAPVSVSASPEATGTPVPTPTPSPRATGTPMPTRTPSPTREPLDVEMDLPEPSQWFYFTDLADVLSEETRGTIFFASRALYEYCGVQLVVATVKTTGGIPIEDYAYALFNKWGIGDARNEGMLILMAIDDGDYCMVRGAASECNDFTMAQSLAQMVPHFKKRDYDKGAYESFFTAHTYASSYSAAVQNIFRSDVPESLYYNAYIESVLGPEPSISSAKWQYGHWAESDSDWSKLKAEGGGGVADSFVTGRSAAEERYAKIKEEDSRRRGRKNSKKVGQILLIILLVPVVGLLLFLVFKLGAFKEKHERDDDRWGSSGSSSRSSGSSSHSSGFGGGSGGGGHSSGGGAGRGRH